MEADSRELAFFGLRMAVVALALLLRQFPACSAAAAACDFPSIFNFGDSNSDTGGLSAAFGQAPPPNGETYFHRPSGRYCDGRLLIDFIAEDLRLPHLSAYLDSVGSNFSHGANFATAGSPVRPQNMTLSQSGYSPIALNVQLYEFSDFLVRSQYFRSQGGVFTSLLPPEEYFSRALYTFDIGQNDLTAGLKQNMTIDQIKAYIPDVMTHYSDAIKKVYDEGGRSFWIHNTGPLGCLIYIMDRYHLEAPEDEQGCLSPFNELAQSFNARLKQAVDSLRTELPLATITYVDVYSVKYNLITQAHKHGDYLSTSASFFRPNNFSRTGHLIGFQQPFVACCGHGGKYNYNNSRRCGFKITVEGKEIVIAKSCEDPSVRVSWDGIHFTEAANRWIFEQIVDGSYSDPPVPLNMACHRMDRRDKSMA
ncbi:GDSL esterase/lipase At3g26430 isoform X1 [Syzygium oleosum]|uniref:GDSL esterase/lipase At3g26430 isoform X1 n=1 Tax=Syzygium oleosum TaxID=219896 RepID=UPI0011D2B69D|nr:GDSL esterase/lipase At3g26430 isoform X1 [Syzygium oleosum]